MSRVTFQANDFALSLPAGFIDRSVQVLEWSPGGEQPKLCLVIHRADLAEDQTFDAWFLEETKEYPTRFTALRVEREEREVGQGEGVELRRKTFRWKAEEEVLYNHQVFLLDGRVAHVFTGTGLARHREAIDTLVDETLAGLRLRGE